MFAQVEAVFDLRLITSQCVKYLHVVSTLSPEEMDEFGDVLKTPDPSSPCDHFKVTVLDRKIISERSHLQQLPSTEDLGDRQPSQLLHCMQQLLGDRPQNVSSPLHRELFLQRQDLVVVLAAAGDVSLDKLVELAHRVSHYSGPRSVAVIPSIASSTLVDQQSSLEAKIYHLTSTVAALRASIPRRFQRSSDQRLRHRSSSSHRSSPARDGFCWYHCKFNAAARQRRQHCLWSGNAPASH
ncbi:uncharacterized protein LOC144116216 [Amblyomma americanum]